jgi:hypothetical protein
LYSCRHSPTFWRKRCLRLRLADCCFSS